MIEKQRTILVYADWQGLSEPTHVGTLLAAPLRGKEVFSFSYDPAWLKLVKPTNLDPSLQLLQGPQYPTDNQHNFGAFLDSSPDRFGRLLMNRKEALLAREEGRKPRTLLESDYLLGVYDGHRLGALRFRLDSSGPFLDNNTKLSSPPWTHLRELEHASLELERDDAEERPDYAKWLQMLIVPGSSLGGARPKASVKDEMGNLWIAKFPSRYDIMDIGAWEMVIHQLALQCGIVVPSALLKRFNCRHRTYLSRRFDRDVNSSRVHFASAMTQLQRKDGDDGTSGASYLDLAESIALGGARPDADLEQLWRRIVFSICTSNVDDHLRNHGFLLQPGNGWVLSPAFDMNPVAEGNGLRLNISESDNAQDLELVREVAPYFRLNSATTNRIIEEVLKAVRKWPDEASNLDIPKGEQSRMASAFRLVA